MDVDLLNKALALCSEIEERQAQLKEILKSLVKEESAYDDKSDFTGQDLSDPVSYKHQTLPTKSLV